jgi:hypothetical protein
MIQRGFPISTVRMLDRNVEQKMAHARESDGI